VTAAFAGKVAIPGDSQPDSARALVQYKASNAPALNTIWGTGSTSEGRGNLKAFKGLTRAAVNLVSDQCWPGS
jgi:hypothetical protein